MPRVLIFFGTTDGHTAKIATRLGEDLRDLGATVNVVEAGAGRADPHPRDYDAVIVAASLHLSNYQRPVREWVQTHARELSGMPSAFLSVCLGMLQHEPEVQQELRLIMERFFATTGWRPTATLAVAGALLYSRYGWLKRWGMRHMARRAGVETDPSRDYEYTDWEELRAFAESFLQRVQRMGWVPALH